MIFTSKNSSSAASGTSSNRTCLIITAVAACSIVAYSQLPILGQHERRHFHTPHFHRPITGNEAEILAASPISAHNVKPMTNVPTWPHMHPEEVATSPISISEDQPTEKAHKYDKGVSTPSVPQWSEDYAAETPSTWCEERYDTDFLRRFTENQTRFCSGPSSSLHCFASKRGKRPLDYLCVARGVSLDKSMFQLSCDMVQDKQEEYRHFPKYMWWTGVKKIIDTKFKLGIQDDEAETDGLPSLKCSGPSSKIRAEQTTAVVVKRDGGNNMWHSLVEIMSYYQSMDIFSMATDENGEPYWDPEQDSGNLQVLWADDHKPGPYSELWSYYGGNNATHVNQYEPRSKCFDRVLVPLPGGQSPMWDGDWEPRQCTDSSLVRAFGRRVRKHMQVRIDAGSDEDATIVVSIIDRTKTRQLDGMQGKIQKLRDRYPGLVFQTVDALTMTFKEQLTVLGKTNVLVGTHGAGLTGQMFMKAKGSVVELLPQELPHKGFRNLASLLGHGYFSVHGVRAEGDNPKDWHRDPVRVDDERFMRVMDMAIGRVLQTGARNFDAA